MQVRTIGNAEFRELGRKFRQASNGKTLRRNLTKRLQTEIAKPAVVDVRAAVMAVHSKGVRGGGVKSRAAHQARTKPKSRVKAHGLRASVARTITSRVKYSGRTVGIRVRSDTSSLPADQKRMPRNLDKPKGWRHPIFGNHEAWVHQTGQPYWAVTLRRYTVRARTAVNGAVDDALKELKT